MWGKGGGVKKIAQKSFLSETKAFLFRDFFGKLSEAKKYLTDWYCKRKNFGIHIGKKYLQDPIGSRFSKDGFPP